MRLQSIRPSSWFCARHAIFLGMALLMLGAGLASGGPTLLGACTLLVGTIFILDALDDLAERMYRFVVERFPRRR